MIGLSEAFEHYRRTVKPLPGQELELAQARGRVLAADVLAAVELPPFRQSAMDGYALRAADTAGAAGQPVRLRLTGTVAAGRLESVPALGQGEAMRIYTGSYVPDGADTVLRQEDAVLDGEWLVVARPLAVGDNVRQQGEELGAGTLLAPAGLRLTAGLLGALAVAGVGRVVVHRLPRVAVLTTGDEVVPPGQELGPGEIYDANTALVTGWLAEQGCHPRCQHLPDDLAGTTAALEEALSWADLAIATGGVSVGDRDYVPDAAAGVGMSRIFWKVRQKPGKPLFFAVRDGRLLLGLPGNPAAVFVCLTVHVQRVLDLLTGAARPGPVWLTGRLGFSARRDPKRVHWLRCRAEVSAAGEIWLRRLPHQASHMISNLAACTALVRLMPGPEPVAEGEPVTWTPCGAGGVAAGVVDPMAPGEAQQGQAGQGQRSGGQTAGER